MRKFYFLIVIMILLLATTIGIKAQTSTINVGNVDPAYVGQTVTVPITVQNFTKVGAFQFQVNYDQNKLEFAEDLNAPFMGDTAVTKTLADQNPTPGVLIVEWNYSGSPGTELTVSDGLLFGLKFYVKSTAATGFTTISLSGAIVVDSHSTPMLKGTTNGSVNIATALTPSIQMQLKSGNNNVLQLVCQNFLNYAGFTIRINYPVASYPNLPTTGSFTFATGITGDVVTSIINGQIFMAWSYSGYANQAVTLGTDGSGVLAEINFGTAINSSDVNTTINFGTKIVNTVSDEDISLTTALPTKTATARLGTVANATKGSVVSVPLIVTNFNNVGAFQFAVSFPNTQLELAEVPTFNYDGSSIATDTLTRINSLGSLVMQWNYSGGDSTHALNFGNDTLMHLKFFATGNAPGNAALTFSNSIVVTPRSQSILKDGYPGSGLVIFRLAPAPVLTLGKGTVGANNKVTIPITVTGFTGIAGFNLHVVVPSSNFTITSADINASDAWNAASLGSFVTNVTGTNASLSWVYSSQYNLGTLSDGATMGNLVFTYTGPATTDSVTVTFASANNYLNTIDSSGIYFTTQNGKIYLVKTIKVKAKAFLQGPYSGSSTMTTTLNSNILIPLNSNTAYDATAFGYTAKTVTAIPNANVVDWVLVDLRTGTASTTKVETQPAFLLKDGSIVDVDGSSDVPFSASAASYYIVVRHRNHLAIMSHDPVTLSSSSALYDFTTDQTKAYGSGSPMKSLATGVFGMYAGNANNDAYITTDDFSVWLVALNAGATGYNLSDFNLNGFVTTDDFSLWLTNLTSGAASLVP